MQNIRYPVLQQFQKVKNWKHLFSNFQATGKLKCQADYDWFAFQRGYWDFGFFARYFFSHHCKYPFSTMHEDFCAAESNPAKRGRREAIAAPRGNAKTTFKVLIKIIHALVYGYEPYILLITHSAPEGVDKLKDILDELQSNPRLLRVYGELAPVRGQNKGLGRWGSKSFTTQNGIQVKTRSKGQEIRGTKKGANRPSLIICDDIESLSEVLSPEQRKKTRDWYYKDIAKCGQVDGSSNIIVIGTCLHEESLLSELLKSPAYNSRRYQSILSYSNRQDLWDQWQKIACELSNPKRHDDADQFFQTNRDAMLEGTAVLWPEVEPYEYLMRLRMDEGFASFQSEKQNEPHDPELYEFDLSNLPRFSVHWQDGQFAGIERLDQPGKIILREQLQKVIAFHDPAVGKKPGQYTEPDYAAIVVLAKDQDGYLYCLDAFIERVSPQKQIEQAFRLHERWGLDILYLEDNNFQDLLKAPYAEYNARHEGRPLRVKGVTQTQNKRQRISMLEPELAKGHLFFAENINPRLLEQLRQYPTGYDDGPDALQAGVSELRNRRDSIRRGQNNNDGFIPPWMAS